jgi:uncharacterized integral membrane protein
MAVPRRSRYEEVDRWRSSRPWSWLLAGILIGIIFSVFIYMQLNFAAHRAAHSSNRHC